MTTSDVLAMGLFGGFGLWWVVAPRSVAAFYTWFSRGKAKIPRPRAIRVIGAAWTALVVAVIIFGKKCDEDKRAEPGCSRQRRDCVSVPS